MAAYINSRPPFRVDIKDFHAGRQEQQYQYRSFLPAKIDQEWTLSDAKTLTLLEEASRLMGELNTYSQIVPDVDFFIRMHLAKEATTSSRIEGTQTNMHEVLVDERDIAPEKRDDWQEVHNYIEATNFAIAQLQDLPLSNRLLRQAHGILMRGVRGKHKQPGEFRTQQNWIGVSLKHATFVPPHPQHVLDLMSDLEKFMRNDQIHVPHLIRIGLVHYQFETIHPFNDGNGRIGRLLIVLYLVSFGLLAKPALYLSDFFERNKGDYYDQLTAVRGTHNVTRWLQFFLLGICETAASSIQVFKDILALKERIEREKLPIFHPRRQANAQALMRLLYQSPIISIKQVADHIDAATNTASTLVRDFVKHEILQPLGSRQRDRLYVFAEYVNLFNPDGDRIE